MKNESIKKPLFKLHNPFAPSGSQPEAIKKLVSGRPGKSVLLGVTGSGKTFTIANVIAQQEKPVLIISPNKTLAAQLYEEFSRFFPENKVCYFVSYYDYYQPESYMPAQDIYIPKETKVNSEIERLRVEATASVITRRDTIIIASVSCIYSLGNPNDYRSLALQVAVGQKIGRDELIKKLISIEYKRNLIAKDAGTFQVFGSTIEVNLPYLKDKLRIECAHDTIESLQWVNSHTNNVVYNLDTTLIFPAKHFVTTQEQKEKALVSIKKELEESAPLLQNPLYRERLITRVNHDLEMLSEIGYCSGIENYTLHFDKRNLGTQPFSLLDFFGDDYLIIIDESHIAIPQLRGMYAGDRARKKSLIEYGFRLPSAAENRPLKFEEIEKFFTDVIFVSATPGHYELLVSDTVAEQIIRPTGLIDPLLEIHGRTDQIAYLIEQIQATTAQGYRTLITVLTKKLAEQLATYLEEQQLSVCYLHSDLKTPERTKLLQKLRDQEFDCLVGVNLLREGLDLPEVALVAIMDADVESFLRDQRSLIQTIGRAARNTKARVILFADKITGSMKSAIDETNRRRTMQQAYNEKHSITPVTVTRKVIKSINNLQDAIAQASARKRSKKNKETVAVDVLSLEKQIKELERAMKKAAQEYDFETAIRLRTQLAVLKK